MAGVYDGRGGAKTDVERFASEAVSDGTNGDEPPSVVGSEKSGRRSSRGGKGGAGERCRRKWVAARRAVAIAEDANGHVVTQTRSGGSGRSRLSGRSRARLAAGFITGGTERVECVVDVVNDWRRDVAKAGDQAAGYVAFFRTVAATSMAATSTATAMAAATTAAATAAVGMPVVPNDGGQGRDARQRVTNGGDVTRRRLHATAVKQPVHATAGRGGQHDAAEPFPTTGRLDRSRAANKRVDRAAATAAGSDGCERARNRRAERTTDGEREWTMGRKGAGRAAPRLQLPEAGRREFGRGEGSRVRRAGAEIGAGRGLTQGGATGFSRDATAAVVVAAAERATVAAGAGAEGR